MPPCNMTCAATEIVSVTATSLGSVYFPTQADIFEDVLSCFVTYVSTTVNLLLFPMGVATSIVNIIVYCRLGIRECVNITFTSLSSLNLVMCFMSCVSEILSAIAKFVSVETVNMMSLVEVFLTYTRGFTYVQLALVTVFMSMERCVCIMFPVEVKNIFTPRRVIIINMTIVIFGLACGAPMWAAHRMHWVFYPSSNKTRFVLWVSRNIRAVEKFAVTFNAVTLPVLAQIIIAVSAGCMLRGINQSAKFRQRCAAVRELGGGLGRTEESTSVTTKASRDKGRTTMTSKDVKLTKVVLLFAVKSFIFNLPVLMTSFLRTLIPLIRFGEQHYNLYMLLYNLALECRVVNCMADMFVYYNISSRYRKVLLALFSRSGLVKKT